MQSAAQSLGTAADEGAAAIAANKKHPLPANRASGRGGSTVGYDAAPSLRPKVGRSSLGLHSAAPPAAARAKLKIATRPFPVKHRLTIHFPSEAGCTRPIQPIGWRSIYDIAAQDPAGPDRTKTGAARMVVELLRWDIDEPGRRRGVGSRGLWSAAGTGPAAKSASTAKRCVTAGICTSR